MRPVLCGLISCWVAVTLAPVAARQRGATPPAQILPLAVNTIVANPDAYVGSTISVTASVGESLSGTIFSLRQPSREGTLLVVAPTLTQAIEPNGYVTVLGTLIRYSESELSRRAKDYQADVPPGTIPEGTPAVIATSVLTGGMVDLARRAAPAMTPDELAFQSTMKQVQPAFNALRQAADKGNGADAKEPVATLQKAFADVAPFWASHKREDATQWTADARRTLDAIATAMGRNDWETVKSWTAHLGQTCQSCHGVYRERLDDGTSRFKNLKGSAG